MVRVVWTRRAADDLQAIVSYVEDFDPGAAGRLARRLTEACESLSAFSNRGSPAPDGTRRLRSVRPYAVPYEVVDDEVHILSIRHAAQIAERD